MLGIAIAGLVILFICAAIIFNMYNGDRWDRIEDDEEYIPDDDEIYE